MKFKVREGYVVTLYTQSTVTQNGREVVQVREQQYFEGQEFDLTPEQADLEAARIEPLDAEAVAFLDSKVVKSPAAQPAVGSSEFNDAVAAAVAAALAAAGVKPKATA